MAKMLIVAEHTIFENLWKGSKILKSGCQMKTWKIMSEILHNVVTGYE